MNAIIGFDDKIKQKTLTLYFTETELTELQEMINKLHQESELILTVLDSFFSSNIGNESEVVVPLKGGLTMEEHDEKRCMNLDKKILEIIKDKINLYGKYLTMEVVNEYSIRLNFIQKEGTPKRFYNGYESNYFQFQETRGYSGLCY